MPGNRKNESQHRQDVVFLADRLALALMMLRRQIDLAIVLLPSYEDIREELAKDDDYDGMKHAVRQILERDREKRK